MYKFVIALVAALIASPAFAAEQVIKLKQAPGVDKVEANCQACHTLAYIPMNSPFLNAAGWSAAAMPPMRCGPALRACTGPWPRTTMR